MIFNGRTYVFLPVSVPYHLIKIFGYKNSSSLISIRKPTIPDPSVVNHHSFFFTVSDDRKH